ncbi:hypothetical protein [Chryseosolibacter indicus]|uniref:Uncharacterized protein n=1 Tax=Chryseosolibacter indicus TaxID=2782351 RepID=A0ABS5VLY8_9BACT|nr:hypothetical protein [Chryseosolibacter indicus]MBT1702478.1 hypothetical protein [Chryseosolibacter indicus]
MAFLEKLLGKKKPELKARCPITKEQIESGFGYLLTTAQVVASKKYWDMIMTEPETISYSVSHFKNQQSGTQMRTLIFEKYSNIEKPWMISDSCINLFENIDRKSAKEMAKRWWESAGNFAPENSGPAFKALEPSDFQSWKDYAVLEAGRSKVILS